MAELMESLGLSRLSPAERLQLLDELWDSLSADLENTSLTAAQCEELESRWAKYQADPSRGVPWETAREQALRRLGQ